jgi:hypothetical protein
MRARCFFFDNAPHCYLFRPQEYSFNIFFLCSIPVLNETKHIDEMLTWDLNTVHAKDWHSEDNDLFFRLV